MFKGGGDVQIKTVKITAHLHWLKTFSFCHKFDFNFTLKYMATQTVVRFHEWEQKSD